MRILGDIPHPRFRIVAYTLEHHFYIEIEAGPMKQCFKLHKDTVKDMAGIKKWLDEEFLDDTYRNFEAMYRNQKAALERNFGGG